MNAIRDWLVDYWRAFSFVGLVCAALFFSASVTPSLLPRHFAVQGILSGVAIALGYGFGVAFVWVWRFLELSDIPERFVPAIKRTTSVSTVVVFLVFLRQMTFWQNSIRQLMEMDPLESAYPYRTGMIALLVGVILITLFRLLGQVSRFIARGLNKYLPRRISWMASGLITFFTLTTIINGVLISAVFNAADASFAEIDALIEDNVQQPLAGSASGSPESLIDWATIGRRGKLFVVEGPTRDEISEFTNQSARDPIRVYVGLRSAKSMTERAKLALEELKRVGGFNRSILVVATPTGTGWLDPSAVDTIEYLHHGDTAIVSMQYSHLPSWMTIMVDPDRSRRSAQILFDQIYGYWKSLPHDGRPKFYLHGLSLGSLGSEVSDDLFTIFEDPTHGAVWSGPPFPSTQWAELTLARNAGTPSWLPEFRDGAMVRFTGQQNSLQPGRRWGPMRNVYLQYASDPMVFFSTDLLFHEPEWLKNDRGPDVSPHLTWYPMVTFIQIAFDLPMATSVPIGYGHNYAPAHYINAWLAVTEPPGWNYEKVEALKREFEGRIPTGF